MRARHASVSNTNSKPLLLGQYNLNYESEPRTKKDPSEKSQHDRSSSYQSGQLLLGVEPKFNAQRISLKTRGLVAQEILTPLRIRNSIANHREYSSNYYDNTSFAALSREDAYRSGHAQLNASSQMPYIGKHSGYTKRSVEDLQGEGFMDEGMKKYEEELEKSKELEVRLTEHKKKTIAIKKLLANPHYIPKLSANIVRQQRQEKSQERPKSVTILVKKGKGKIANSEWNNKMWLHVTDDENKDDKEFISRSTVEEYTERQSGRKRAATLQSSRFTPNIKVLRESLSPEPQISSKAFTNTSEKPVVRKMSSFRDDRSESSARYESKHSIILTKMGDEFKAENSQPKAHFRRKSDTSSYSGGECLKLALHMHIVLPSDANTVLKKTVRKTSTSTTEPRREETKFLTKSKSRRDTGRPKEIYGSLTSPKDFLDDQHLETIASQTYKLEELGLVGSDMDIQAIKDLQRDDLTQLEDVDKGTSNDNTRELTKTDSLKGKIGANLEEYWKLKSKTPEPNGHLRLRAAVDKAVQSQTARNVKQKEMVFDKRIKQGDLKDALKIVFSMNKKAEATVFRDKSAENIKTLKLQPTNKSPKRKKRSHFEIDIDRSPDISPYIKPINFRRDDSSAFLVSTDKRKKELVLTPLKKRPDNKKKTLSPKRTRSLPKITPLSVLEKTYL